MNRVVIIAAHPDDETIGCGAAIAHWPDCVIVHTTDGSPYDLGDARREGFSAREAYSAERRRELKCALDIAGGRETIQLGFVDQESWRHMSGLTERVTQVIQQLRPDLIYTHPFEGGHPDHDAAAFAVAQALRWSARPPKHYEFAGYHRSNGALTTGEFLPEGPPETGGELDRPSAELKRRMFACFNTQHAVLSAFSPGIERFRPAPEYDFSRRPHAGPLHYETLGWGITFEDWAAATK